MTEQDKLQVVKKVSSKFYLLHRRHLRSFDADDILDIFYRDKLEYYNPEKHTWDSFVAMCCNSIVKNLKRRVVTEARFIDEHLTQDPTLRSGCIREVSATERVKTIQLSSRDDEVDSTSTNPYIYRYESPKIYFDDTKKEIPPIPHTHYLYHRKQKYIRNKNVGGLIIVSKEWLSILGFSKDEIEDIVDSRIIDVMKAYLNR